jgi:hypothetical protein
VEWVSFLVQRQSYVPKERGIALSYSTTPESVEALMNSISDKDTSVRERIRTSLTGLTGHSVDSGVDQLSPEKAPNACRFWWGDKGKVRFAERLEFVAT